MVRSTLLIVILGLACMCAERSAVAEEKFAAQLPEQASIELVGVVRLDAQPRTAWLPDGTPREIPKEWPEITQVKSYPSTHGFVFQCRGFQPGQGLDWRLDPIGVYPTPVESVPEFITVSSNVDPTLETASIRAGLLTTWGPWQRVEVDTDRKQLVQPPGLMGKLYKLVDSVDLQVKRGDDLPVGFVLNGFSGKRDYADFGEFQALACDLTGKRHSTCGAKPFGAGQIPYFKLPYDKTRCYSYRMRPILKWANFDNIALAPEAKTEVKVTVTDSGLAELGEK